MNTMTPVEASKSVAVPRPIRVQVFGSAESGSAAVLRQIQDACRAIGQPIDGAHHDLNNFRPELADAPIDLVVFTLDATAREDRASRVVSAIEALSRHRAARGEVSGFPVLIAVMYCDFQDGSSTFETMAEIMRQLGWRLDKTNAIDRTSRRFNALNVSIAPVYPDVSDPDRSPRFGEQFAKQLIEFVTPHRASCRYANRRLAWSLVGTCSAIVVLLGCIWGLTYGRGQLERARLAADVELFRHMFAAQSAEERLRQPLEPRLQRLESLRGDAVFGTLPTEDRQFVDERLRELDAYMDFFERLQAMEVASIDSEAELVEAERLLQTELVQPEQFAVEWQLTDAIKRRKGLINEISERRAGIKRLREAIFDSSRRLREVEMFADGVPGDSSAWRTWAVAAKSVVDQPLKFDGGNHAAELPVAELLRFDSLQTAQDVLLAANARIRRLVELVQALGMTGSATPSPLNLRVPQTLEEINAAWAAVRTEYPLLVSQNPVHLPDAVAPKIRAAAAPSYESLIDLGRTVVARELKTKENSLVAWRETANWLNETPELEAWRNLIRVLGEVSDPSHRDPVKELLDFVMRDEFLIHIESVKLELMTNIAVQPDGSFNVYLGADESSAISVLTLNAPSESKRDTSDRALTFQSSTNAAFKYVPGQFLYARLPVRVNGMEDWILTWARRRNALFAFESLDLPPRLHRSDQTNTDGKLQENIRLRFVPETGVPKVPDLVPVGFGR